MRTLSGLLLIVLLTLEKASQVAAQNVCKLCPDGSAPGNPDLIIPLFIVDNGLRVTCEVLASLADLFNDCENAVEAHAGFCGCAGVDPINACSFCPDGTPPANPDALTPLLNDRCQDLDLYASFLTAQECTSSFFLDGIRGYTAFCGCAGVEPACTLCPDGSPPPNPNTVIPGGLTCQDVADVTLVFDQETCAAQQRNLELSAFDCACEGATEPQVFCTLCPNATSPPNPDFVLPFHGRTCEEADTVFSLQDEETCAGLEEIIRVEAELCECEGVEVANCTLCPDGSEVAFPDLLIPRKVIENEFATCGLLDSFADALDTDCEDGVQSEKGYCGCNGTAPINACTFCPDGSDPPDPELMTPFGFSCGDVNRYVTYFSQEECMGDSLEDVRHDAAFCGCPGAEPACTLCPDGSPPQTPALILPDGTTCQASADVYSVIGAEDCVTLADEIETKAARCGCAGVVRSCSLCPDGSPPLSPGLELRNEFTCQNAADLISTLSEEDCNSRTGTILIDAYRCGCTGVPAPTCASKVNPDQCTEELLATTDANCECYNFCDGVLIHCDQYEDIERPDCDGATVFGCSSEIATTSGAETSALNVWFCACFIAALALF